jgi:hypothetical protein
MNENQFNTRVHLEKGGELSLSAYGSEVTLSVGGGGYSSTHGSVTLTRAELEKLQLLINTLREILR